MKITWIGHSCFKVEKDGYAVVIDPYQDGSVPGLLPVREKAQMVICTHEHADHYGKENITVEKKDGSPFTITELSTFHDDAGGVLRGRTKMYILDDGENRIAHLGDLGCRPDSEQIEQLKNLDALLIPVGGYYTIDAKQASELVRELEPRIVIPMHFRDDDAGTGYDVIGTVKEFTETADSVVLTGKSTLETAQPQPAETMVLKPQNCA